MHDQRTRQRSFESTGYFFETYAKNHLLEKIKQTLEDYGVQFDVWFSEKTLHESGDIERAIKILTRA